MEVHAHTHTARKKWTHYFWEFLMLFLAVFCGFLAEYQLEHKIEKDREKKFMLLLVQDIQSDIDSIAKIKIHRAERYLQAMSLHTSLINGEYKSNGADVYYWGRNVSRRQFFLSADGTMQQLKSSGNLRLVRSSQIIQKIIAYDVAYRNYLQQLDIESELVSDYRMSAVRIFDAGKFKTVIGGKNTTRPDGNPQLIDTSLTAINELSNKLNYMMAAQFRLNNLLDGLSKKAVELSGLIKKEYRLK
ncbi:MAG TPA: hypothetical protein VIU35_04905 [Chitinophagaceae bacterium]